MSISLLLEMAGSSAPDRTAVVSGDLRLTTGELSALADGGAGVIAASGASQVVVFREELPTKALGKVLRRELLAGLQPAKTGPA